MKFKLEIDCDNDAFGEEPAFEVLRILKRTVMAIQETCELTSGESRKLCDSNGNTVGSYALTDD